MLNGLDLFSGIGGISLALQEWVRPVAYCENNHYAQAVLLSRMADGNLPPAPIWDDVTTLDARSLPDIDIITAGFPCQDISCANQLGTGLEGQRSGLFFEIMRLADEIRPRFIFLENVPAILVRGLGGLLGEITKRGYDCRWTMLRASDIGANHRRERWFLLAHARSDAERPSHGQAGRGDADQEQDHRNQVRDDVGDRREDVADSKSGGTGRFVEGREQVRETPCRRRLDNCCEKGDVAHAQRLGQQDTGDGERDQEAFGNREANQLGGGGENVAHADGAGRRGRRRAEPVQQALPRAEHDGEDGFTKDWWSVEPDVGRVAHGIPRRVDKLTAMGNAVVPLQAKTAFKRLMGI